ncbi:MAG: hypothetical protein GY750_20935 [Lentisphaerae bacterium]|nr:hypothetical protein [Lentisphaerota bacterium]
MKYFVMIGIVLVAGCSSMKKLALKEALPRAEKEIPKLVNKEIDKLVEEEYITPKVAEIVRPVILKVLKRLDDKVRIYLSE